MCFSCRCYIWEDHNSVIFVHDSCGVSVLSVANLAEYAAVREWINRFAFEESPPHGQRTFPRLKKMHK